MSEFFQLYQQLNREGPGEAADVAWALAQAGTAKDADICDAACGSGADILPLLKGCPDGRIRAFDKTPHFIDEARVRVGVKAQVDLSVGDMTQLSGAYDLIWCAGAVYFSGVENALKLWQPALKAGGLIAFSHICWWTDTPAKPAHDFWVREYPAISDQAGIGQQVRAAGYETIATRRLAASAWENYHGSLERRIAVLNDGASKELQQVLDEGRAEIALWRKHQDDFGYLLSVVKPL